MYTIFFLTGILMNALGFSSPADATKTSSIADAQAINKSDTSEKLYFSDVMTKNSDGRLIAAHYSHSSHQSHVSHYSHRSGY